ncbi:MAG: ATP-dependent DNA helicase RecQ, partial [Chitinophagia bacterium]|nr:ATP-dependent DNA helicase RecQ [Chitinophagia bacterium]
MEILQRYWGYSSFRPLQESIIESVIAGQDTLALLPTGGGKSVCYQVPALLSDGTCLVVSPLIALMRDQVKRLTSLGIAAVSVDSGKGFRELKRTLEDVVDGNYQLLYVSPERLQQRLFTDYLSQMELSLIAVDEAHCVSQWGHDFRPSYLKIAEVRDIHPKVPMLALTASATPAVQDDICQQLQLRSPRLYQSGYARANIFFSVHYTENKPKEAVQHTAGQECAVIYCRSRKGTEQVARHLQQQGNDATVYHAGLPVAARNDAQEAWLAGTKPVMVATTAFGMGIDKANVRLVLHYDVPEHLEAWYQEVGRAGRDGKPANGIMLYNQTDIDRLTDSTDIQFPPEAYLRKVYQSVNEYLQLPVGVEPNKYFPFDLHEFCDRFKFEAVPVLHALKILEREGLWTLTESIYTPSTVQFIVNRQVLDSLVERHHQLGQIVT